MAFSPERAAVPERIENVSAARMRLWHALHDFCRQHGGAVVSVPGDREIRIEAAQDSPLAAKLSEAGYDVRHCCVTSRITAGAFTTVDVISILLPGK